MVQFGEARGNLRGIPRSSKAHRFDRSATPSPERSALRRPGPNANSILRPMPFCRDHGTAARSAPGKGPIRWPAMRRSIGLGANAVTHPGTGRWPLRCRSRSFTCSRGVSRHRPKTALSRPGYVFREIPGTGCTPRVTDNGSAHRRYAAAGQPSDWRSNECSPSGFSFRGARRSPQECGQGCCRGGVCVGHRRVGSSEKGAAVHAAAPFEATRRNVAASPGQRPLAMIPSWISTYVVVPAMNWLRFEPGFTCPYSVAWLNCARASWKRGRLAWADSTVLG